MAWTFLRVYFDQETSWETLKDAERGRLLLAALKYAAKEELPDLPGNERYQWPQIKVQIDKERQAYLNKVNQCSEAGKKSAEQRANYQHSSTTVNDRQRPLIKEQEQKQEQEQRKEKKAKADAFAEFAGDNAYLLQALQEFKAMRSQIKKPLTPAAQDRLLSKLKKDFSPAEWIPVLNQSVDHCWQDIYKLKEPEQKPAPAKRKQYSTAEEYNSTPKTIDASKLDSLRSLVGTWGAKSQPQGGES